MSPADIDRVFGRGRLRMVTGDHVEVFREEALPGERRRYTKRFLATAAGDFRHWTEREWRILARLVGHGIGPVPDVVQFDRGLAGRVGLVQTYDAGITVDHWATLLPVQRDGEVVRHIFQDCGHWWALARHSLIALDAIHEIGLVHLDLKADNVCLPFAPVDFDPHAGDQALLPRFEQIALIDFAFSLVSGEQLERALPIARQPEYDYQSPRLLAALEAGSRGDLAPTRRLDWRCDLFSLAAMLRRYLPDPEAEPAHGWTRARDTQARALVRRLLQAHDDELPLQRPHAWLFASASLPLADPALAASLQRGWQLVAHRDGVAGLSPTPVTRIALPVEPVAPDPALVTDLRELPVDPGAPARSRRKSNLLWAAGLTAAAALAIPALGEAWLGLRERLAPRGEALASAAPAPQAQPSAPVAAAVEPAASAVPASMPPVLEAAPAPAAPAAAEPASAPPAMPAPVVAMPPPVAAAPAPAPRPTAVRPGPRGAATSARVAAAGRPPTASRPTAVARPAGKAAPPPVAVAKAPPPPRRFAVVPRPAPTRPPAPPVIAAGPTLPAAPVVAPVAAPPPLAAAPAPAPVAPVPAAPLAPRDLSARAGELMSTQLPRIAQRAERLVLRVLVAAAGSEGDGDGEELRSAARAIRLAPGDPQLEAGASAGEARALNEAARTAFWRRNNLAEALSLQTRAFGANPLDAEVVGNLAFLRLKQQPDQPEVARQLALHALTTHDPRYPHGRVEDWTTLAITNALTGRERDARNAWWVSFELAPQAERQCRAAVNAYAVYGERLRAPVEAMLYRAHASGRGERSALCEWPPHWSGGANARR